MNINGIQRLAEKLNIEYRLNEAMSLHTAFKIGGNADILLLPESAEQLKELVAFSKENAIPYFILGKGSNLLVSDNGIEGAVISTLSMKKIELIGENELYAEAGASLAALCRAARDNSLSGLEFAYGIPGSVGGALYMNAGAYGGDMSMVVTRAVSLCPDTLETVERELEDMELGYRKSVYEHSGEIILGVTFSLVKGDKQEIGEAMDGYMAKRKTSQPLDFASAGSTFKRPDGYYAAALIDECGLKGVSVGDAQVSEKHAGFVINRSCAAADDVLSLIEIIKRTVKEKKGVELETEVIYVGK